MQHFRKYTFQSLLILYSHALQLPRHSIGMKVPLHCVRFSFLRLYVGMKFPKYCMGMKFPQTIHRNCILFIILLPADLPPQKN